MTWMLLSQFYEHWFLNMFYDSDEKVAVSQSFPTSWFDAVFLIGKIINNRGETCRECFVWWTWARDFVDQRVSEMQTRGTSISWRCFHMLTGRRVLTTCVLEENASNHKQTNLFKFSNITWVLLMQKRRCAKRMRQTHLTSSEINSWKWTKTREETSWNVRDHQGWHLTARDFSKLHFEPEISRFSNL